MIIVNIKGGLGNQMFGYALYKSLQTTSKEIKLDFSYLNYNKANKEKFSYHSLSENMGIFNLDYTIAEKEETDYMLDQSIDYISRLRRKVFGRRKTYIMEHEEGAYYPDIFKLDNVYIDGYWQTEKYFKNVEEEIRRDFIFPNVTLVSQKMLLEQIEKTNSVCLHVRRGDYLMFEDVFGKTDINYYTKAIEFIESRFENLTFYIFTNDIAWAKNNFQKSNIVFVENYDEMSLYNNNLDMYLMSKCKHNIIANSSFSWWGAWLNANKDKCVIAPKVWLLNKNTPDIWCDTWIKL